MNEDPKPVKRCVCFDKSFDDLQRSGLKTVHEIAEEFGCTTGCGLCRPYIERMLETGETKFAVVAEN